LGYFDGGLGIGEGIVGIEVIVYGMPTYTRFCGKLFNQDSCVNQFGFQILLKSHDIQITQKRIINH
jgi:hypothetical protein